MSISLISRLADVPLAFVDVETTGASCDHGDRVIEVGIARVEGGQVTSTYQQLIDPRRTIGPGITALTGISNEMVQGQPTFSSVADEVRSQLAGAVVVGHNVPFDLAFLRNEFAIARRDLAAELAGAHIADTLRIARKHHGTGGNSLQRLAERFNCKDSGDPGAPHVAHRALADSLTTYRVFGKLLAAKGPGWDMTLVDLIQAQGGVMRLVAKKGASPLPEDLQEALDQGAPVELEYVDVREARTVRVITPVEVRRFRGEMILLAWCATSQGRRTFKVDRIVRLTKIDQDSQTLTGTASAD